VQVNRRGSRRSRTPETAAPFPPLTAKRCRWPTNSAPHPHRFAVPSKTCPTTGAPLRGGPRLLTPTASPSKTDPADPSPTCDPTPTIAPHREAVKVNRRGSRRSRTPDHARHISHAPRSGAGGPRTPQPTRTASRCRTSMRPTTGAPLRGGPRLLTPTAPPSKTDRADPSPTCDPTPTIAPHREAVQVNRRGSRRSRTPETHAPLPTHREAVQVIRTQPHTRGIAGTPQVLLRRITLTHHSAPPRAEDRAPRPQKQTGPGASPGPAGNSDL
jgi:hypothetical protein